MSKDNDEQLSEFFKDFDDILFDPMIDMPSKLEQLIALRNEWRFKEKIRAILAIPFDNEAALRSAFKALAREEDGRQQ